MFCFAAFFAIETKLLCTIIIKNRVQNSIISEKPIQLDEKLENNSWTAGQDAMFFSCSSCFPNVITIQ